MGKQLLLNEVRELLLFRLLKRSLGNELGG
jgi:hypothetical protein